MHTRNLWRTAGAAVLALTLAACGDAAGTATSRALAPGQPSLNVDAAPEVRTTLKREHALVADVTQSFTMKRGGVVRVPEAGLTILVPNDALPADAWPFTFTVTALKGDQVAYKFGPSGTVFQKPLQVTLRLDSPLARALGGDSLAVAYFRDSGDLSPETGTVNAREILPVTLDPALGVLRLDVHHFSGYTVIWGRGTRTQ